MRFSTTLFVLLLTSSLLFAQKKIIVTSAGDIIPIKKGQSAERAVQEYEARKTNAVCTDQTTFGYKKSEYPCNNNFVGYHRDVWGQWFIAPSSGTIDSFYFYMADQNNLQDSSVKVAIWKSNLFPGSGPGYGPYHPPRHGWGYYLANQALEEALDITPFRGRRSATDTAWKPTNRQPDGTGGTGEPDAVNSFDPLGDELWGLGGFPVKGLSGSNSGVLNVVDMMSLFYTPTVEKGDPIFVTIEHLGTHISSDNDFPATWCMTRTGLPTPNRNWKFYNHPAAGSSGWHARSEATWVWSFVMSVDGNIAPDFLDYSKLSHTLSTGSRTVTCSLQDCNPGNPSQTGIASITLTYWANYDAPTTVNMSPLGGDNYQATLPGVNSGGFLNYYMTAIDVTGDTTVTATNQYKIIKLADEHYIVDTNATFNYQEIRATGTQISDADFFTQSTSGSGTDDGTAGPIDMGADFILHGDTIRYAWIGVNGGVAFSRTAADTQQVQGAGGSYAASWVFPGKPPLVPQSTANEIPDNLVCVFYNDMVMNPVIIPDFEEAHGWIYYQTIGSKFIVEWDSLGNLNLEADSTIRFQLIMDNSDNTVTFNYLDVGVDGLEAVGLVGIQSDTVSKWSFLVKEGTPVELRPRNNRAFKYLPSSSGVSAADGWNMLSVSVNVSDNEKSALYPGATSPAFRYQAGYTQDDSLDNGVGYWLKFNGAQTLYLPKLSDITAATIPVNALWNMVGSISTPVPVANLGYLPDSASVVGSQFFGYNNGYFTATDINPGKGYWFKAKQSGSILISTAFASAKSGAKVDPLANLSQLKIRDSRNGEQSLFVGSSKDFAGSVEMYDMPPVPPSGSFDARFGSNRMVETHSAKLNDVVEYAIKIQSENYPVSISWNVKNSNGVRYELVDKASGKSGSSMIGMGTTRIEKPSDELVIRVVSSDVELPQSYSLEQNYPNPFNPATTMKYSLPKDSHVKLSVFNVLGQEIATVFEGVQSAGYYNYTWSPKNSTEIQTGSGVYFYRLDATNVSDSKETFNQVRKMMFVK
ncbi:MAG: T9SS type A sorting domain-containing protein [Ignavibacteriales bacterium]|nr:T9SS type A sorting domain-containing protein [Ignavibacteriales bacterium]